MDISPLFIAGSWVETKERVEIRSPYDGKPAGSCCLAGPVEMESAIAAAHRAMPMARRLPSWKRRELCRKIAEGIGREADRLAAIITAETGKPIRYSRAEVARGRTTFDLASDAATDALGEVLPADMDKGSEGYLALAVRVPRGPVAAISPFNFPLNLVAHKVAPAFASGCPVVLKPPPQAPLTSLLLARICQEAGLPEGLLSVLPCSVEVASSLVSDPRVRTLSFTGSAEVGWRLRDQAVRKHVVLELGGNAAAVVHSDADVAFAAPRLATGAFAIAGQVCISVQRILIQESVYDTFRERFLAAAGALKVGDPSDPATVAGPVIDGRAADRILAWVDEARAGGATVHALGIRRGNVLPLFVVENAPPDLSVCCEEVFGPVVVLDRYAEFDEALRRVNEGVFGLQAGVFTADIGRAMQAAWDLDVGGVIVNDYPTFRVDNTPYGGTKDSGMGREGVRWAVREMTETRVIVVKGGLPVAQS